MISFFVVCVSCLRLHEHERISDDTYYLGTHQHPHERFRSVEGYGFLHLHTKRSPVATSRQGLPPPVSKQNHFLRQQSDCSSPIADGARWKVSQGYTINTRNRMGLSDSFVQESLETARDTWNCALANIGIMAIGPLLRVTSHPYVPRSAPMGENTVRFGRIDGQPGTVALTSVWGVFTGPAAYREITEFDMVFNEEHFRFGNASEKRNVIDFLSAATHEWGHALGLDDAYLASCSESTMYATSVENETKKRTLDFYDAYGIDALYALDKQ